jgi:cellulose synthase (UDP-forming)
MAASTEATSPEHSRAIAPWALRLGSPAPESRRSRLTARTGGLVAVGSLLAYLTWRIAFTLPAGSWNRSVAFTLIGFEALPLIGLIFKAVTLWNIDASANAPVLRHDAIARSVTVLIPTYNEPVDVIAPTIAASCALEPAHETWVLDDGDRPWVADMCRALGARYVSREVHDHAKAGNLNHALSIMESERTSGQRQTDIIAVLDCDHVPLPTFLTATLGWFDDHKIALVQGPQAFYNTGAFDDDGFTGEQGLFFNVLMPARQHAGVGPFWCGSTSLLRVDALREIGGVATETITEDMHTTLKLIRAGWKTAYHDQTLAVGLAPATPDQYLLQRRRWGMGAMQILIQERLWAAKRWMSWRNFYEYLNGTLWWLEGIATLVAFAIPIAVMMSGAQTSTASPLAFTAAFTAMFTGRLWGAKRLLRGEIHWPTAFALRIFRIPVGLACLWWLVSRKALEFAVTPKGAAEERLRGRPPRILWVLTAVTAGVCAYAAAGVGGIVPWRTPTSSTVASGLWLALAGVVLLLGLRRIRAAQYATSRRNAHRFLFAVPVRLDGMTCELVDISTGGAALRLPTGAPHPVGLATLELPGVEPLKMEEVFVFHGMRDPDLVTLRIAERDWDSYAKVSTWLFQTPAGAVPGLPAGVPVVAASLPA